MNKTNPISHTNNDQKSGNFPFAVTPYAFEFVSQVPIGKAATLLNKMKISEPPSDVAVLRIDGTTQRFHVKTRALHTHLVEAQGYFKRIDDNRTQITGEAFGQSLSGPLLIAFTLGALALIIVTQSVLVALLCVMATVILFVYCRRFVTRVDADERTLAHLIEETLSVTP